jgi:DNA-binding LacI/PurR family transcriptional regulator
VIPIVKVVYFKGAYLAVKHLIDMGHEKIMYLAGIEGSLAALKESNIKWVREIRANLRLEDSYKKVIDYRSKINNLRDQPTAMFAANNLMAIVALRAFNKLNISVPKKLSIIGFDNIAFSGLTYPALPTISQPVYQIGVKAADILLKLIKKQDPEKIIIFEPTIIKRCSVRKI